MVLTKEELIARLQHEINLLLHLTSKIGPGDLDYRPAAGQRSLRELLEYLMIFAPIHLRAIKAGVFEMEAWRKEWEAELAEARLKDLEQIRTAIGAQSALFERELQTFPDADLRSEMEMFGRSNSRGSWLVWMLLSHYAAYRMQLFLYLKACGHPELNTMNLWAGIDAPPLGRPTREAEAASTSVQ